MKPFVPDLAMVPRFCTRCLCHAHASVLNGEGVVGLVRLDDDLELGLRVQHALVRKGGIADLVNGIASVGNELTQEHLLV